MMRDFYLTLPSNTPGTGNITSRYRVNLPSHIDLQGEWEVGLSEIFYPNSWSTLKENDCFFLIVKGGEPTREYTFPPKRFHDIHDLIASLNDATTDGMELLKDATDFTIKFYFKKSKYRVCVDAEGKGYRCVLSKPLQYMLGYDTDVVVTGEHQHSFQYAQHAPDVTCGFTSLLIYCDLIAPQVVGNVNAQILRVVNIENVPFGESVCG